MGVIKFKKEWPFHIKLLSADIVFYGITHFIGIIDNVNKYVFDNTHSLLNMNEIYLEMLYNA